jgi:ABC-type sugar transport system permease subunit
MGRHVRDGPLLIPFMIVYLLGLYLVVQAVRMGFFERDLLTIDRQSWIGFDNYRRRF